MALSPTNLVNFCNNSHFLIVLATIHSKTLPLSSFNKWTSSIITNFKLLNTSSCFLVNKSHFSGIPTNKFVLSICSFVKSTSPLNSFITKLKYPNCSLNLFKNSFAKAFNGTKNNILKSQIVVEKSKSALISLIFFNFNSRFISLNIVINAILVLPAPVGAVIKRFSSLLKDLSNTVL